MDYSFTAYRDSIRSHYAPNADRRDIASEAYEKALAFIKTEFRGDKEALSSFGDPSRSINDIYSIAKAMQEHYSKDVGKKKKCLKWLNRFSARIMYYGQVMDVFAQHHPEYVALVWGTMKFVLMSVLNRERIESEFLKAIAKIGDALKFSKLSAELYQTDEIRDALSQMYGYILLFLQRIIAWYRLGSWGRVIGAVTSPWELQYEDIVKEIHVCANNVTDFASAASRAETRDMHITVRLMHESLHELREQQNELYGRQEILQERIMSVLEVVNANQSIVKRVDVNVLDMTPRIRDMQLTEILKALKPIASPDENLDKIRSIFRRSQARKLPQAEPIGLTRVLRLWFEKQTSSIFFMRVGPRAEANAKELTAEIVSFLSHQKLPVIWHLSSTHGNSNYNASSVTEVLRSLVYQAFYLDQTLLNPHAADEFNASKYRSEMSKAEVASLFHKMLSRLSRCYIVIEAEDLFRENNRDKEWAMEFLGLFSTLVQHAMQGGNVLKILVLSYGNVKLELSPGQNDLSYTLPRAQPTPVRLRRTVSHKKKLNGWQRVQPKI